MTVQSSRLRQELEGDCNPPKQRKTVPWSLHKEEEDKERPEKKKSHVQIMMAVFLAVVTQSKEVGLLSSRDARLLERAHPLIN